MDAKLRQAMWEAFDRLRRNTIPISYRSAARPVGTGRSKIGGKPDLPEGFEWPYYEGRSYDNITASRPLAFMAQINLSEAAAFDQDRLLPETGMLSFFYEMESEKWGFDPKDKGCAAVFYFEEEKALIPLEFPADLSEDYRFPEFDVSLEQRASLPSYGDFYGTPEEIDISARFPEETEECEWEDYDELRQEYGCVADGDWSYNTKLLGYPDVIQNPMEQECEEVTRGIPNGGEHEISPALKAEIEQASKDWILLFQMGTVKNDTFELMFGDVGHIYFWIKRQDLAARDFKNIWLILQCG